MRSVVVIAIILLVVAALCNAQTPTPTATTSGATSTATVGATSTATVGPTSTATVGATPTPTATPAVVNGTTSPAPTANPGAVFGCVLRSDNVLGGTNGTRASTSGAMGIFLGIYNGLATLNYLFMHNVQGAITAVNIKTGANATQTTSVVPANLQMAGTAALTLIAGQITLQGSQFGDIYNNMMYVEVVTAANPNGEIRGNIGLAPYAFQNFGLLSSTQVPGTKSSSASNGLFLGGQGNGGFLSGSMIHNVASATSQIIGQGSNCTAGSTVLSYPNGAFNNGGTQNVFGPNVDANTLSQFKAGNTYAQVNSATNPNGDIRGQLVNVPDNTVKAVNPVFPGCFGGSGGVTSNPTPTATSGAEKIVGSIVFASVVVAALLL